MKSSSLTVAIAAVLACACASAQTLPHPAPSQDKLPSPQLLDRTRVFADTPLPASSQSLSGAKLQAARAIQRDSAGLLKQFAGAEVQAAGGLSGLPLIHGMAGDRNRVQVDGMDLIASCPNHMNPPLSYIDPANIGHIRVFTAISPVSAGGDSIGGSIAVESRRPAFAASADDWQLGGHLGLRYHSNGHARHADASLWLANARWHLRYEGNHNHAENYRAAEPFRNFTASGREGHEIRRDEVASSAYRSQQHSLHAAFRHGAHLWQGHYALQTIPQQNYPNQRMDMLDNRQYRWQLGYQGEAEWGSVEARLWQERVQHVMGFGEDRQYWYGADSMQPGHADHSRACAPIGPRCAADMPMHTASRTRAARFQLNLELDDGDLLRLGQEWQQYRLDDDWPPSGGMMWPGTFWNIHQGRRDRASLFAEWEGRLGRNWQALLGVRHTRIHTTAGEVRGYDIDPRPPGSYAMTAADAAAFNARNRHRRDRHLDATALLRWTPSTQLDVEAGIALKTRSPNLYERYAWSSWAMAAVMNNTHGDGNGYVGDPDLAPEKARTLALTLDWHAAPGSSAAWRLRLTPWHTRVRDYIDATPAGAHQPGKFQVLRYANQSARLYGLDISGEVPLATGAFGSFSLQGNAQWQRGKNLDSGHPLYQQMPAHARLSLQHQHQGWQSALEWQLVAAKTRTSPLRNELATGGYGLLNLRLAREFGQWRFDAGVDNLLNRPYAHPTAGIYLGQGRSMAINGLPHGIPVPGMGRSFHLALRRDW